MLTISMKLGRIGQRKFGWRIKHNFTDTLYITYFNLTDTLYLTYRTRRMRVCNLVMYTFNDLVILDSHRPIYITIKV